MELVSDYMREDTMRHALNELTRNGPMSRFSTS